MIQPELLLTPAEMKRADSSAVRSGTPGVTLMRNAGAAVVAAAREMAPGGSRIVVLAGPGQNGGDGIVAAALLLAEGYAVSLFLLGRGEALYGDAAIVAKDWPHPMAPLENADLSQADLVIDALFGGGLSRDIEGAAKAAIERTNMTGKPVLAVDLPSGIDGETGTVRGIAIRATRTVTFAARKPGHVAASRSRLRGSGESRRDRRGSGRSAVIGRPPPPEWPRLVECGVTPAFARFAQIRPRPCAGGLRGARRGRALPGWRRGPRYGSARGSSR